MNDKFLGFNGFVWFVGVVEARNDPTYTGRLKVRALGHHTGNKEILPTADLPWASCMLPVTAAGITGLGQSPSGLVEGSWVLGYFRDGNTRQEPIIMGSLPGRPSELANTSKGFYDPNGVYPKYKDEPDTNRLAVNLKSGTTELNPHLSLTLRRSTRITGVATADFNPVTAADGSAIEASDGDTFDQPTIPYAAEYPYNKVYETESGHIRELDDTPSNERIHERHRTGTSYEISPSGTRTDIIKGDHFTLLSGANKVSVGGNNDVSIDGRHKIYINKSNTANNHYDIQVGSNANVNIQVDKGDVNLVTVDGKINVNSGGDYNVKVDGNYNMTVAGSRSVTVEGTTTDNTTGAVIHRGSRIDLNP
mgnify:FL=1